MNQIQPKAPSVAQVMGRNLPEKKFKAGAIEATIWSNDTVRDGKTLTYKTVTFSRNYKDKSGVWKTTNSLRANDLPKAVLVLNKAYEYLSLNDIDSIDEEPY